MTLLCGPRAPHGETSTTASTTASATASRMTATLSADATAAGVTLGSDLERGSEISMGSAVGVDAASRVGAYATYGVTLHTPLLDPVNTFITRPIAQAFGMEVLLAVELVRDETGFFTGDIAGVPTLREGKVTRVQQWLEAQGLSLQDVEATFYSDSMNDLPLLEQVQHPVVTNGSPALKQIALARGWRILDLFENPGLKK